MQPRKTPYAFPALALALLALARPAPAVTLADCVSSALKNSPAIAALQAQTAAADSAYARDRSSAYPSLALSDEASYSHFGANSAFSDAPENKANAEFSLDLQRLIAPPGRLSELEMRRSRIVLAQAQAQLRRDVTSGYDKLQVLRRQTEEQHEAELYVDGHIRDIEQLEDSGLDVSLDLLRAKGQRRALELTANARDAEWKGELAALRSLTGLALVAGDFLAEPDLAGKGPSESGAVDSKRLSDTFSAQLAALDLQAARAQVRGSGRFSAPSLRLGQDLSFLAIDPNTPMNRTYVALSFDAFDWGQRGHEAEQLRLALEVQSKTQQEQLRLTRLLAEQLSVDISQARRAFEVSSEIVKDSQRAMEIAKAYYRQGKIKESDLLSVFADYLSARDQRDVALLGALDKQADWEALWPEEAP